MEFQFPKKRRYPVALATFLFYLAWHPLGDFAESLFLGWSIVPCQIFTKKFWTWWWPFARLLNESYLMAFFGYFIPITGLSYFYLFLRRQLNLKKSLAVVVLILTALSIFIPPVFLPSHSVAYKNDIEGFVRHHMQPLSAWMAFHLTWAIFLLIWLSSWFLGKIVYIPIEVPPWCV